MADLAKQTEDLLDVSEAGDNKPNENGSAEDHGSSVDGSPVDQGPFGKGETTNLDLLLGGGGGDGFDPSPVTQPTVQVDLLSGSVTQTDEEVGGSQPSEPLLDFTQPTGEPNTQQVQDPFNDNTYGVVDTSANPLTADATPSIDSTGERNSLHDGSLEAETTADVDTQDETQDKTDTDTIVDTGSNPGGVEDTGSNPGGVEDTGSNPGSVEVTAEINATDLPVASINNPVAEAKDSLTLSTTSEGEQRLGSSSSEGAGQDDTALVSGGSDHETKENKLSGADTYRAQPVLDASKLEKRDSTKQHKPRQPVQTRQQRQDEIKHKNQQRRAAVEERKRKQLEEEKERKELLVRRSRERSERSDSPATRIDKRRSWSAFGSRDAPPPALSASTPRGRSAERMAEKTERPTRPVSASSSLGVNKRLSSSMSTVFRPVHLVRLGPNADDWFEVHLPVNEKKADRRSSSPGTDKNAPRHHSSSPNLASNNAKRRMKALYSPRDIKSAQSTPTHTPRPLSSQRTSSNSRLSPAKTTDDIKNKEQKATTPRSTRPASPRQRPASPATSSTGRAARGDATDSGKKTPGRAPSPRTYGRASEGDASKRPSRTASNRLSTPSQAPPIKKSLTPTAANSPSRSSLRSSTAKNSSSPSKPSTPRREPTSARSNAKKDASSKTTARKPAAASKKEVMAPSEKKETAEPVRKTEETAEATQPIVDLEHKPQEKTVVFDESIVVVFEGGDVVEAKLEEVDEPSTQDKPITDEGEQEEAAIPAEAVKAAIPTKETQVNGTTPKETKPKTPDEKPEKPKEMTAEERAKAALAERRREAREKAEREAELERQRKEQEEREEQERLQREEEERIRQEEEDMRLAIEHRKAEEERLQKAIEENKRREEEERIRAEEEAREKEEEERKRQEEIAKREEEIKEKLKKEEEERDARKKRVEEIMKRARRGAQAAGQEESEGSTPPNDDTVQDEGNNGNSDNASEDEPKTNGVSSSSILNNEKYRNLLINRSRLSDAV